MTEILDALKALQVSVDALRDEIRGLRLPGPTRPDPSDPSAAPIEAVIWEHFGAGHVPASAYSALPAVHPVRRALAGFARAVHAPPPETAVAIGCLLRRLSRLPGSRLRYRRMTSGGRWHLAPEE